MDKPLYRECLAEGIGTFILVFFGVGSVHVAVLTGALEGLWQVAVVWGVAISLAIYALSAISGAHINPSITLAFAAFGGFARQKILPYISAQVIGAILAAGILFVLYQNVLAEFEAAEGIVRGQTGSELSAMCYGEYFPNPAIAKAKDWNGNVVTHRQAMLAEGIGTAFLAFFVFAVTDSKNRNRPRGTIFALFIGLTVSIIISVVAPLTQAGLNPARDFGPRVVAFLAGWKSIAIPGPRGGFFTVYILSPILGAMVGAGIYQYLIRPGHISNSAKQTNRNMRLRRQRRSTYVTRGNAMEQMELILVGGFLGAGKTTLLAKAAQTLVQQGKKVGLITNDQAQDLVDTEILQAQGFAVQEIAGGCFCCKFENLIDSSRALIRKIQPHVLMGEPVGSCTDISATVLQPLKKIYGDLFKLAPFSVLIDPYRLREAVHPENTQVLPGSVAYIARKQLEEADIIVLNKVDLLPPEEVEELQDLINREFPGRMVLTMSALSNEGVADWLDALSGDIPAGQTIAEVDYDTYADGEAMLGWLNASVQVNGELPIPWTEFCRELLLDIQQRMLTAAAEIAHLKLFLKNTEGSLSANLTGNAAQSTIQAANELSGESASLTINLRANHAPELLQEVVQNSLDTISQKTNVQATIDRLASFRPGRPEPVHRFDTVTG
jgi:glycerol uptake facilitator